MKRLMIALGLSLFTAVTLAAGGLPARKAPVDARTCVIFPGSGSGIHIG